MPSTKKQRTVRVRKTRTRPEFTTTTEAIDRLKKFGCIHLNGVVYSENRLGLKVLGAVDFLAKKGIMVKFTKAPKGVRNDFRTTA